ncbi:MAG: dockerin type I domain-containing protein [Phycisphaerales bacterium]|jgi:hypothetical protein
MRTVHALLGTTLLLSAATVGQWSANADSRGDRGERPRLDRMGGDEGGIAASVGPDVIVGALPDVSKYGTVAGISAYALGTTSCNIGDEELLWISGTNQHPVIGQNLYRVMDGRIEMVGMSWLKHGFFALSGNLCGSCQSTNGSTLGIGCSDPYSSGLNGSQSGLGPKSQVNAATGHFPYPFNAPPAQATIGRRMQVKVVDLDPALNPGALYFGEGHYVTPDDAAAGNDDNNASYRRMTVGSFSSGSWTISFTGPTQQQTPAIHAWQDHGLGVNQPDPDVQLQYVDVPGDGRFIVGHKVSQIGENLWHYEYAIHNLNSDRSGRAFEVPVPAGVEISNVEFKGIPHHSGEPFATGDWTAAALPGRVLFRTQNFDSNPDANALRWGTLYNFRFDANVPPAEIEATLELFKPGEIPAMAVMVPGPSAPEISADVNGDGIVDGADLTEVLAAWGTDDAAADINNDGTVDGVDLAEVLAAWQ